MTGKIEVEAFLADAVQAVQGKLYAVGIGWNIIWTSGFPTAHDRVGIGIVIRVPWSMTNENHSFEIRLEDEDGQVLPIGNDPKDPENKLRSLGADFNVGRPPASQHGDEQIVVFAIQMNNLVFETPGRYVVAIDVDGEPGNRLPFRVAQQQQAVKMRA